MDLEFLTAYYKKVPARQREWHIDNQFYQLVMCKTCNSVPVNWSVKNKRYSTYCCSKCANTDPSIKQKRADTCLARYGSTTNLTSPETQEKIKQTCLDRYGVDNYAKTDEFRERMIETSLANWGVPNPSQHPDVKAKIDASHQKLYNRKRSSQQHLSVSVVDLKNNKDLMLDLYKNQKMPVTEIAELLGVNHSQLCIHFKNNLGIDISRHNVSRHERQLHQFLNLIGVEFEAGIRTIIPPKELDIWIPEYRIAIELNGLAWHSELAGKDRHYHLNKTNLCNQQDIRLIHIWDSEWINTPELVKSRLNAILGKSTRIYARACDVVKLSNADSQSFFDQHHIQGSCISNQTWGLVYRDKIVAAMSFGKPRFNKSADWELLRFANAKWHNVIGGASRLFTKFLKENTAETVISYCDRRWNTGNLYVQLGFDLVRTAGPNYWYTQKYQSIEHRTNYQKHKLAAKLQKFDPELSEWENMKVNNFDRVWDCGNWVFEYHAQST